MKLSPDIESWLSLGLIDGLGDESERRLLLAFGGSAKILSANVVALERVVSKRAAHSIALGVDKKKLAVALKWLEDPSNSVITLADPDYPSLLLNIPDPPPLLCLEGRRELLSSPALAIVGSRNVTPQGLSNAGAFTEAASNAGLCILSGMALGVDAAAPSRRLAWYPRQHSGGGRRPRHRLSGKKPRTCSRIGGKRRSCFWVSTGHPCHRQQLPTPQPHYQRHESWLPSSGSSTAKRPPYYRPPGAGAGAGCVCHPRQSIRRCPGAAMR
jgi:hypothetical protein